MDITEVKKAQQQFGIIGNDPGLLRAIDTAIQVAKTDLTVLITGESGVGKEFFPKIIHTNSVRKHGKYIAVNCGAIPEGTIDSELFGHVKGAFTGAVSERKGYFSEANGGTIFLDEVAELPLPTQARLLRVLENGEYLRVGSSEVEKTNVRIVCATNVNLPKAIADGRFREDLYYRLSTVPITVPPLRSRGEDVVLLFKKFCIDFAAKYNVPRVQLDGGAVSAILEYSWPGNIRQLKNIAEQVSILELNRELGAEVMSRYLPQENVGSNLPVVAGLRFVREIPRRQEEEENEAAVVKEVNNVVEAAIRPVHMAQHHKECRPHAAEINPLNACRRHICSNEVFIRPQHPHHRQRPQWRGACGGSGRGAPPGRSPGSTQR